MHRMLVHNLKNAIDMIQFTGTNANILVGQLLYTLGENGLLNATGFQYTNNTPIPETILNDIIDTVNICLKELQEEGEVLGEPIEITK